jgi:hypothetical protein
MTHLVDPADVSPPLPVQRRRRWGIVELRPHVEDQPYTQGALALTFPMTSGIDAEPFPTSLYAVGAAPGAAAAVPDPQAWAARFLQAVVEVVSSDRPLTQLVRWTQPSILSDISRRRQAVAQRTAGPSRTGRQHVASVHVSRPHALTAEVAARVSTGPRSRALAARLEFQRDRWLCTALDFG